MTRTGRPPKHPDERADAVLSIRLNHGVIAMFDDAAARAGVSRNAWIVDRITRAAFDELEKPKDSRPHWWCDKCGGRCRAGDPLVSPSPDTESGQDK